MKYVLLLTRGAWQEEGSEGEKVQGPYGESHSQWTTPGGLRGASGTYADGVRGTAGGTGVTR